MDGPHDRPDGGGHRHFLPSTGAARLLPVYDPLTRLLGIRRDHAVLLAQAGIGPGDRVLEIGCGTGNLAMLAKRQHPSAHIIGLDPDGKALERAARKAHRAGLDVQWDHGYGDTLPYLDDSFEVVLSAMMLHHLEPEDRPIVLREVARVLAPRGSFVVLDVGGPHHDGKGVLGRVLPAMPRVDDNLDDRVPAALRAAGLVDVQETGHRVSRVMGRLTTWRATAPASAADDDPAAR